MPVGLQEARMSMTNGDGSDAVLCLWEMASNGSFDCSGIGREVVKGG